MIRVTIEIVPHGVESKKRHLHTAEIWNDATGTKTRGNYRYRLSRRGQPKSTWKEGELKDFPRKRLLVWDLLYRTLKQVVGHRN